MYHQSENKGGFGFSKFLSVSSGLIACGNINNNRNNNNKSILIDESQSESEPVPSKAPNTAIARGNSKESKSNIFEER